MKRLVVNADDFGLTEGVNRGIVEAHERGILTSATLLANGEAFESAVALAQRAASLGVGVHLNLTDGRPVSDTAAVPSLVNAPGCFWGRPGRLAVRLLSGKIRLAEVERELRAQIEKVCQAGVVVTHLDGHMHVHMLPAIFPIAIRLARACGIPAMRLPVERRAGLWSLLRRNGSARSTILKQHLGARAVAGLASRFGKRLREARLAYPSHFYGLTQTGFLDAASLSAILMNLPEGTSELMCHPGYADRALHGARTRLVAQREAELAALTSPEIVDLIHRRGIELIDYCALARG
ncbi:MAG: ChbG/HpnK family deacetylase [Acidobacteria bacterium]|nr:ChbG/HpnK family deacetylase [Acidobacteriota bacterium]